MRKILSFAVSLFFLLGIGNVSAQNEIVRYGVTVECDYPDGVEQVCQVTNNSNIQLGQGICNQVDSVDAGTFAQYFVYWQQTTVDSIFVDGDMVWNRNEGMNYSLAETRDYNYDIIYYNDNHTAIHNIPGSGCIGISFREIGRDHSIRVVHADIEYVPNVVYVDCIYEKAEDDLYYGSDAEVPYEGDGSAFNAADDAPLCGEIDSVIRHKHVRYYVLLDNENLKSVAVDGLKVWTRENGLNYADARVADEEARQIIFQSVDTATLDTENNRLYIGFVSRTPKYVTLEYATIEPVAAISSVDGGLGLTLTPNPAATYVSLSVSGVSGRVLYSLHDISGRIVRQGHTDAAVQTAIELSSLSKGTYFVRLTTQQQSTTEKLIVR